MNIFRALFDFAKIARVEPTDPKSFHTPMLINETMVSKYGKDWITFLPETIRVSLKKDFNLDISETLANKIFATQTIMINPNVSWDQFIMITFSFNNEIPDFRIMELPSMSDVVWSFVCIKALQPDWELDEELEAYIKNVMLEHGVLWLPWMNLASMDAPNTIDKIKEAWKTPLGMDDIVGTQIDKLSIIKEYVNQMSQ